MEDSSGARDPVQALRDIAFALEAAAQPSFRSRAFEKAAKTLESMPLADVIDLARRRELQSLPNIGETMERTIIEALQGQPSAYLERLNEIAEGGMSPEAKAMRAALKGDCHVHSDWSDGGSPIEVMAQAALSLGNRYMVL